MIDRVTGEVIGPFLRSAYNYDTNEVSDATALHCLDETRTQQQFKEETDINTIVERFGLTGELPSDVVVPMTGDFTEVVSDYQSALNLVREAEAAFMELPAKVRDRFANDPQRLQEFVENADNREEAAKLGLLVPPPVVQEPLAVRVVPDVSPAKTS